MTFSSHIIFAIIAVGIVTAAGPSRTLQSRSHTTAERTLDPPNTSKRQSTDPSPSPRAPGWSKVERKVNDLLMEEAIDLQSLTSTVSQKEVQNESGPSTEATSRQQKSASFKDPNSQRLPRWRLQPTTSRQTLDSTTLTSTPTTTTATRRPIAKHDRQVTTKVFTTERTSAPDRTVTSTAATTTERSTLTPYRTLTSTRATTTDRPASTQDSPETSSLVTTRGRTTTAWPTPTIQTTPTPEATTNIDLKTSPPLKLLTQWTRRQVRATSKPLDQRKATTKPSWRRAMLNRASKEEEEREEEKRRVGRPGWAPQRRQNKAAYRQRGSRRRRPTCMTARKFHRMMKKLCNLAIPPRRCRYRPSPKVMRRYNKAMRSLHNHIVSLYQFVRQNPNHRRMRHMGMRHMARKYIVKEVFNSLDLNNDGRISKREIERFLELQGVLNKRRNER